VTGLNQFDAFVYIVRPGDNPELRVSLRSVHTYFPGVPVYIVGDKPSWVTNVHFLKGNPSMGKPQNVWANLVAAFNWDEVPERVVAMNDDFMLTDRVTRFPELYRCTLKEHLAILRGRDDWWSRSMHHTASLLPGDALSYELHMPFPCLKSQMAKTLDIDPGPNPPQWRTLYGNQWITGARKARHDVKLRGGYIGALPRPFASTTDVSFRDMRRQLFYRFPYASPFEAD
jgi:hypothetical protein